jgi:hypothetical protein
MAEPRRLHGVLPQIDLDEGLLSIERLIVCLCGHCIDQHIGDGGCRNARGGSTCSCPLSHRRVLDELLELERKAIHQQWERQRAARRFATGSVSKNAAAPIALLSVAAASRREFEQTKAIDPVDAL